MNLESVNIADFGVVIRTHAEGPIQGLISGRDRRFRCSFGTGCGPHPLFCPEDNAVGT